MPHVKISVLMASHNRRDTTLASIQALEQNRLPPSVELSVILLDDASDDGTAEAVKKHFPFVTVVSGSGSLYWGGGMRAAFDAAAKNDPDFFLWLNDDTLLAPNALVHLLETQKSLSRTLGVAPIVVGTVVDPDSGEPTYGGVLVGGGWHPLGERPVFSPDTPQRVDTFCGNCVLIPRRVVNQIGHIDEIFTHQMGDYDFGLRAGRAGFPAFVATGTVGSCARNPARQSKSGPIENGLAELAHRLGPKEKPPSEWYVYVRRHAGPLWPLFWVWTYVRAFVGGILRSGS